MCELYFYWLLPASTYRYFFNILSVFCLFVVVFCCCCFRHNGKWFFYMMRDDCCYMFVFFIFYYFFIIIYFINIILHFSLKILLQEVFLDLSVCCET